VFRPRTAPEAIDLVSKLLEYTPEVRLSAVEAMVHPFFDELRAEGAKMPNGKEFPALFNFTREGSWSNNDSRPTKLRVNDLQNFRCGQT
jgi:glycogen synthase kinase 3 beta